MDEQNKIFHDRMRVNQYPVTNLALHKVLKENTNPRMLAISTKKTIDDLTATNLKEGEKHTQ